VTAIMKQLLSWLNVKAHSRKFWSGVWGRTQTRFRRMFVMASIYTSLVKCSEDDIEKLNEVNAEFQLANDVKVLRFPALCAPLIWKNLDELREPEQEVQAVNVAHLVGKIPAWLRYGDTEELEHDVQSLLQYIARRRSSSPASLTS